MVEAAAEVTPAQIEARYRVGAPLGTGNYAEVKRAVRATDGLPVALKFIDKSNDELDAEILATEARIMMGLNHPNCIRCYEVLETPEHVILALEEASSGDLFSLYERPGKYTEADAAQNVSDMAEGLAYLHSRNIAHRDLKLENVLVGDGHVLKIWDFGFARAVTGGDRMKTYARNYSTNPQTQHDGRAGPELPTVPVKLFPRVLRLVSVWLWLWLYQCVRDARVRGTRSDLSGTLHCEVRRLEPRCDHVYDAQRTTTVLG